MGAISNIASMAAVTSVDLMLWSLFPGSSIEHNYSVGAHRYEWAVPEYRIVIWSEEWLEDHTVSQTDLWNNNWRYIQLSDDIHESRNRIIEEMNTIRVLDSAGQAILTPRLVGDAGWDVVTSEDVLVPAGGKVDIPSDLFMEMPNHLYGIVQARSSTSKRGLIILPGVIDPAYRGRIYAMAYNPNNHHVLVSKGDRIVQMLFMPRTPHLSKATVNQLSPTVRGTAGFGSTGQSVTTSEPNVK